MLVCCAISMSEGWFIQVLLSRSGRSPDVLVGSFFAGRTGFPPDAGQSACIIVLSPPPARQRFRGKQADKARQAAVFMARRTKKAHP
jgi:hypothetical protein